MSKSSIQRDRIHRPPESQPPSPDSHIREVDDVIIEITQAFCPKGHSLMRDSDRLFDGSPGIGLLVSSGDSEGEVILSPYHGDHSKLGKLDFPEGTRLRIFCPQCRAELPRLQSCTCPDGGVLVAIYLTPELDDGHVVAICNIWGCYRSKVFDQAQLLAAYLQD